MLVAQHIGMWTLQKKGGAQLSSASVELGTRSNDFSRVTQRIVLLFQWELWLIKVVFPVSFLHAGLSSKVALPSRSLCGLPFQTMNNKSLVADFCKVWAYTVVLKAWKKAHNTVQLQISIQQTYSDAEALMLLLDFNAFLDMIHSF